MQFILKKIISLVLSLTNYLLVNTLLLFANCFLFLSKVSEKFGQNEYPAYKMSNHSCDILLR